MYLYFEMASKRTRRQIYLELRTYTRVGVYYIRLKKSFAIVVFFVKKIEIGLVKNTSFHDSFLSLIFV